MGRTLQLHRLHRFASVFFACLAAISLQSALSANAPDQTIRVGITAIGKPHSITVRCNKPFDVIASGNQEPVTTVHDQPVVLTSEEDGIGVSTDQSIGSFQGPLRLAAKEDGAVFEIVSPKARYRQFRGTLEIGGKSGLSMVDELPIEDYVRGVIPAEVPQNFHPEAQKALTVAIRTYALTSMGRHKPGGYDVCDTTDCQGFCGASRDADWVDKIIEVTRGQVLTYKGQLIHAVYSTDCGGVTQSNEDAGFGSDPWPYLRSVSDSMGTNQTCPADPAEPDKKSGLGSDDPALDARVAATPASPQSTPRDPKADYCSGCPNHSWTKTYSSADLGRSFSRSFGSKIGKFQSMEFTDYDSSGRVGTVLIKGDKGEQRMTGTKFRAFFGETVIKSTRITLSSSEDGQCTINGQGYGHGVGLCAYGADGLGKSGMGYVDILKHYYTGAEIKPISDCGSRTAD